MQLKTAIIGLGRQSSEDHIPAILENEKYQLVALCDKNKELVNNQSKKLGIAGYSNITKLIESVNIDVALVAVPHNQYVEIIMMLAKANIHIIKEKPFATNMKEVAQLQESLNNKVYLGLILQRRFNPIYMSFPQMRRRIGKIFSIESKYTLNISRLDEGWRASKTKSGGGALIDMGYHLIDLMVWFMGVPQSVTARISTGNREGQQYNVEDTVNILFDYHLPDSYSKKTIGSMLISRVYPYKQENFIVYGTKGIVELKRGQIRRLNNNGDELEKLTRQDGWPSALMDQLDYFAQEIHDGKKCNITPDHEYMKHNAIIEAAYKSDKTATSCDPSTFLQ